MKRFYRGATVVAAEGGFAIALDGKPVLTPAKAKLVVSSRVMAEAVAAEWLTQGDDMQIAALPLTRLASAAIDMIAPRRDAVIAETAKYAGTDLVCYRVATPRDLAERQELLWQPLIDWARQRFDAPLLTTTGIAPIAQPTASLAALAAAVAIRHPMELTALRLATATAGSLIIALALMERRLDSDAAFAAAELDESYQIANWGEDAEQTRRRAGLRDDIMLADRFVTLHRG